MTLLSVFQIILIVVILIRRMQGNSHVSNSNIPDFHVEGSDFLNTQTHKLCLLAEINASIELRYRIPKSSHIFNTYVIEVPNSASKDGSYCDIDYTSLLRLVFQGVTFELVFKRDKVLQAEAQRVYCNNCDVGNWRLANINITIDDVTTFANETTAPPPTSLSLNADSTDMPPEAIGLKAGVQLQRAYRCTDQIITIPLSVTQAVNIATGHSHIDRWSGALIFSSIQVQPFLVINDVFKDPLLCKDVTIFHAIIITLPIIYFFFFVVIYRVKERYGCPPDFKRKQPICKPKPHKGEIDKKPLVFSSSSTKQCYADSLPSPCVVVTGSPPLETQSSF